MRKKDKMTENEKQEKRDRAAFLASVYEQVPLEQVTAETVAFALVQQNERNDKLHDHIHRLNNRVDRCENQHGHAYQIEEHNLGLTRALHNALDLAERYMLSRPLAEVKEDYLRVLDVRKWAGSRSILDEEM